MKKTKKGEELTALILEIFRTGGALTSEGDRLVKHLGMTSARWKVLGAVVLSGGNITVSRAASSMGQARQGVQRIADEMAAEGLVYYEENPHHKRAKLIKPTEKGLALYEQIDAIQVPWAEKLAEDMTLEEIASAAGVLKKLLNGITAED